MPVVFAVRADQNAAGQLDQAVAAHLKERPHEPGDVRRREHVGQVLRALGLHARDLAQFLRKGPHAGQAVGREQIRVFVDDDHELVAAKERLALAIVDQVRIVEGVERLDRLFERQLRRFDERKRRNHRARNEQTDPIADQKVGQQGQSAESGWLRHDGRRPRLFGVWPGRRPDERGIRSLRAWRIPARRLPRQRFCLLGVVPVHRCRSPSTDGPARSERPRQRDAAARKALESGGWGCHAVRI